MKRLCVIYPNTNNEDIKVAVSELKEFFGHFSYTVIENERVEGVPVLSLWETNLAKERGMTYDKYPVGENGYTIKTVGKEYFIIARSGFAILRGVYRFLKEVAGVEVIACDEILYADKVNFKPLDLSFAPDIPYGERPWTKWSKYGDQYANRLGLREPHIIAGEAHSFISIFMPKEKYFKEHPDWYAPSTVQLCLTNEEMTQEFIKNVLATMTEESMKDVTTGLLYLCHEDNGFFCTCEKCKESNRKYGGESGTLMRFINKVSHAVQEHVKENFPDKTVKIVTLAYGPTYLPPVDENDEPVDKSVVLDGNVIVYICIGTYWQDIEKYKKICTGWNKVGAEQFIWLYDSVFDNEFVYNNTQNNLQEMFTMMKEYKTTLLLDMGHYLANVSFDEWSNYVRCRLREDTSLKIGELTDRFFDAYYKESKDYVRKYFDEINEYYVNQKVGKMGMYVRSTPSFVSKELWKKEQLVRWFDILTDGAMKAKSDKVRLRVERERMTPLMLLLDIYADEMDREELKTYIAYYEKTADENDFEFVGEHGPEIRLDKHGKLVEWRALLLK